MQLKLSLRYLIAFLALTFLMHEAHEIVHTSIGRLICGCWGERDFNVWAICEGCAAVRPISLLATFAGPVFSFAMMWLGASFLKAKSLHKQTLGFSLIFANLPFGRIITAAFGGGDEVWGLHQILENHSLSWTIGLSAVLILCSYPLYIAFKNIKNKRIGYFILFLLAPLAIDLLVVLGLLNTLLTNGILDSYWILGSPMLVSIWTLFVLVIYIVSRKQLSLLAQSSTN